VEVEEVKGKSKLLAIILALIFGPLGLIHARAWITAFVMILIAVSFIITHTGGMWIAIGGRILCAV